MHHEELKVANQDNNGAAYCPLPLSVIPNHMGITLKVSNGRSKMMVNLSA
jgi:hypothetical protein